MKCPRCGHIRTSDEINATFSCTWCGLEADEWCAQVYQSIADEAAFQIARTLNRSRADSYAARQRWWRVYAAYPQVYRDAASRVWQSAVYQATKDDSAPRETRPRELLARLRRPLYSV
jgi:hypothetical protein